jgi:hypothetical protein
MRMMKMMMMTATTILRGWRLASTGSYKTCRKPTSPRRVRGLPRGRKVSPATGAKRRRRPATHAPTPLLPTPRVKPFLRRNPFQRLAQAAGSKPR